MDYLLLFISVSYMTLTYYKVLHLDVLLFSTYTYKNLFINLVEPKLTVLSIKPDSFAIPLNTMLFYVPFIFDKVGIKPIALY